MNYPTVWPVEVRHSNASNATSSRYGRLPAWLNGGSADADWQLVAVEMVPNATIAEDATNYREYTVYGQDGTTAQATRSTDSDTSSSDLSITAGTAESLTVTGGDNAIFHPGDEIKITSGGGGTEPADDASFVCIFKLLR